jgi:Tfp pilus assembly protein PilF
MLKDYAGAADDLEKAKAQEGESPEMLKNARYCNYNLGKKDAARTYLDKAMSTGVKDSKVALYAGVPPYDANDYKGTQEALTAAEIGGEKEDDIYLKRGKSYYQQKEYNNAVADLEKSVQKGKADLGAYEAIGMSYLASQKEKEAACCVGEGRVNG